MIVLNLISEKESKISSSYLRDWIYEQNLAIEFCRTVWDKTMIEVQVSDLKISSNWFQVILKYYSESHRYYHTIRHIYNMLLFAGSVLNPTLVFSVFFHDVIYNPEKKDNEVKSAELFSIMCEELHLQMYIPKVCKYILATIGHSLEDEDSDGLIFLDLDLSILGSNVQVYSDYSKQIRLEYSYVEESKYRLGRKKVWNFISNKFTGRFYSLF